MPLQTVIDLNEVLLTDREVPSYEYIRRDGCLLQCVRRADGAYIDRIISTDPRDYLNPRFQVGELLQK